MKLTVRQLRFVASMARLKKIDGQTLNQLTRESKDFAEIKLKVITYGN